MKFFFSSRKKEISFFKYKKASSWPTFVRTLSSLKVRLHLRFTYAFSTLHCTLEVQVSLVIRCGYVPSLWPANTKFGDKKSIFDQKIGKSDKKKLAENFDPFTSSKSDFEDKISPALGANQCMNSYKMQCLVENKRNLGVNNPQHFFEPKRNS